MPIQPVILAGGVGARLAPLSTPLLPKQFLPLLSDEPMIAQAIRRAEQFGGVARVVGQQAHYELLREHCPDRQLILQPGDKGTAVGVALAALSTEPASVMIVLPSDHVFSDEGVLRQALEVAIEGAIGGEFVCFGIGPSSADSTFGYIAAVEAGSRKSPLVGFQEKPTIKEAEQLIANGWVWNSGMFVVQAGVFLAQLSRFEPELLALIEHSVGDLDLDAREIWPLNEPFHEAPWASVDKGILERTEVGSVVPLDAGWNDVGTWPRLWEASGLTTGDSLPLPKLVPEWLGEERVAGGLLLVSTPEGTHLRKVE